jgi:hypothetical protein
MSDFTDAKTTIAGVWPNNVVTADYERLEPIIGPDELKARFLFGISLVSQMKDPITGKNAIMHDAQIKDLIDGTIQQVEQDLKIDIFAVERQERYPFDAPAFQQYGFMRTEHYPIANIRSMTITAPNNQDVYTVPLEWVSPAYFLRGQVNVVPWLANSQSISGYSATGSGSGGAHLLSVLGSSMFCPAYWQLIYTSGFMDGMVPRIVNDVIGVTAAINILSMLGATYARSTGHSLGIDGMSQSISGPGPNIFAVRIQDLEAQRQRLIGKVKAAFGKKILVGSL